MACHLKNEIYRRSYALSQRVLWVFQNLTQRAYRETNVFEVICSKKMTEDGRISSIKWQYIQHFLRHPL